MLRTSLALILIATIPALATAQTTSSPLPSPPPDSTSSWPDPNRGKSYSGYMDIVTLTSPTVRQHCHLRKLTADTITCKTPHHQPEAVFQRDGVLALIAPPSHDNLVDFLVVGTIVAAVLAASFFVPFGWAIALRIVDGFLLYGGWAASGEFADDNLSDHNQDKLLYQRPNTPLTIKLRTR